MSSRRARNGGTPLLTKLSLARSFGGTTTWETLARLGDLFPELEALRIHSASDNHYGDNPAASLTSCIERGIDCLAIESGVVGGTVDKW